ncbi:hypothetical protein [Alicyclobacillus sp.]|uniref:hypothetical protein n=1 Tax=Alicyclobacillus sp. TaxID=61169 RepID=UPI0025BECADB|nr:hypothetical protein [Alicyclobacillus sp.]MCL6516983.1 hypothetical protein [Alicyclobacillus sp.]
MTAWTALLRKDLRLMRPMAWAAGIGVVVLYGAFLYLALRYHSGAATVMALMVLGVHALAPPVYTYIGLGREWRKSAPLWLHLPQPGWMLLASKLVTSYVLTVGTFLIAGLGAIWVLAWDRPAFTRLLDWADPSVLRFDLQVAVWSTVTVFGFALYAACWALAISVWMQALKHPFGRWRWIVGIVLVLLATWGLGGFQASGVYDRLFHWGAIPIALRVPGAVVDAPVDAIPLHVFTVYAGDIVFDLLVCAILFALSAWVMDRRIEV